MVAFRPSPGGTIDEGTSVVDPSGRSSFNSIFGDSIVQGRIEFVSEAFTQLLSSDIVNLDQTWNTASAVGTFQQFELVTGSTSGASGYLLNVDPFRVVTRNKYFLDGETIEGHTSFATATITSGSHGTVTISDSMLVLSSGVESVTELAALTAEQTPYVPGHESYALFTALWETGGLTGVEQYVGSLHEKDGFALGFSGSQFGILHRRNSVDTFIPQANFTHDKLDGSVSGLTIDTTKLNVFRVSFGFLGAAGAAFHVLDEDEQWRLFHEIHFTNQNNGVIVYNPQFPIRSEIKKDGNATDVVVKHGSFCAGVVTDEISSGRLETFETSKDGINVEEVVFTLRNPFTINGQRNRSQIVLNSISVGIDGTKPGIVRLRKNSILAGEDLVDVNSGFSIMEYDLSGSLTVPGRSVQAFSLARGGNNFVDLTTLKISVLPGETLTLTAESTNAVDVACGIRWREIL